MKKLSPQMIAYLSLLIALEIVFTRFLAIATPIVRISFTFIPVAICGMMFGPGWTALASVIADLLGMLLFNTQGSAFHLGITLNAALTGMVYGIFLYNKTNLTHRHCLIPVSINRFIIGLGIQSYWLAGMQGIPYLTCVVSRIPSTLLLFAVHLITIPYLLKLVNKILESNPNRTVVGR